MEKASYRVVILKRDIPAIIRKTIVRRAVKCIILTIVNFQQVKRLIIKKPTS